MIFREKPADFKPEIQVVACYLKHADKFLLLQRQPHKVHGGKWGLPAGKVDPGEDLETALKREVREETGIETERLNKKYLEPLWVRHNGHDIEYHSFIVELEGEPTVRLSVNEHQDHTWTSPMESLEMDLIHDLDECNKIFFGLQKSILQS